VVTLFITEDKIEQQMDTRWCQSIKWQLDADRPRSEGVSNTDQQISTAKQQQRQKGMRIIFMEHDAASRVQNGKENFHVYITYVTGNDFYGYLSLSLSVSLCLTALQA
jgi:hypothetical protein